MAPGFEPLKEDKKYEKIVNQLKQKVFSGEYQPGDRLPSERELAETLQVSRTSVREAYRALQMFGMIDIRRGQQGGAFICSPSNQSIIQSISDLLRFQGIQLEEWTEARLILELDIARLAIRRADESDFVRLEKVIDEAEQKSRSGKIVHREYIQFHLSLAETARNRIIYTSYRSLMDILLSSFMALGVGEEHYERVSQTHRKLLAVLKEGDEGNFLKEIKEHVRLAGENLMKISKSIPLFR